LETRWLHALPGEKAIDRAPMNAEDAADTHGVEPAVVDQAPDRLGVHAELIRHLANADKPGISACGRHNRSGALQVPPSRA
jgi:hypothetical protein